jgi:hypothetical protein
VFALCGVWTLPRDPSGRERIFVPGEDEVYVTPGGIVRYVEAPLYLPPALFARGVLACPDCSTPDYMAALRNANAGLEPPVGPFVPFVARPRPRSQPHQLAGAATEHKFSRYTSARHPELL